MSLHNTSLKQKCPSYELCKRLNNETNVTCFTTFSKKKKMALSTINMFLLHLKLYHPFFRPNSLVLVTSINVEVIINLVERQFSTDADPNTPNVIETRQYIKSVKIDNSKLFAASKILQYIA